MTRNHFIISKCNVLWGTKEKTKKMLKYTPTIRITNCQTKKYLPVEQQWSWRTVGHSLQTLRQQMGKCRRELPRLYSKDQCLQSRIHESRQEPWGNSENAIFKHYEPGTKQPWWWSYDLDLIKRPWVRVGSWQNFGS